MLVNYELTRHVIINVSFCSLILYLDDIETKPFRKPRWTGSQNNSKKWPPVLIFWREPGATFLGPEAIPKIQENVTLNSF